MPRKLSEDARSQIKFKPVRKPKPPEVTYERLCHACGITFETHRPKAKRCDQCIADGVRAKEAVPCIGCGKELPPVLMPQGFCQECESNGVRARVEAKNYEEWLRAERSRLISEKRLYATRQQIEALLHRERLPRRFPKMKDNRTMKDSPLQEFWQDLCWVEGAPYPLIKADDAIADETTKRQMLDLFFRLKLIGMDTLAAATLDIAKMLEKSPEEIDKIIRENDEDDLEVISEGHPEPDLAHLLGLAPVASITTTPTTTNDIPDHQ